MLRLSLIEYYLIRLIQDIFDYVNLLVSGKTTSTKEYEEGNEKKEDLPWKVLCTVRSLFSKHFCLVPFDLHSLRHSYLYLISPVLFHPLRSLVQRQWLNSLYPFYFPEEILCHQLNNDLVHWPKLDGEISVEYTMYLDLMRVINQSDMTEHEIDLWDAILWQREKFTVRQKQDSISKSINRLDGTLRNAAQRSRVNNGSGSSRRNSLIRPAISCALVDASKLKLRLRLTCSFS